MKTIKFNWKLSLSIAITLLIISSGCSKENIDFDGSRTSNSSQFILSFEVLNTTIKHNMELIANDTVDVVIRNDSGELDLSAADESGDYIYQGVDVSTSEFSLIITQDSNYEFTVTGRKASGLVSFIVREKVK